MVEAGADLIDVGPAPPPPTCPTPSTRREECRAPENARSRCPGGQARRSDLGRHHPRRRPPGRPSRRGLRSSTTSPVSAIPSWPDSWLPPRRGLDRHGLSDVRRAAPGGAAGHGDGCLRRSLERAAPMGIADERIVLDPGIGFFRGGSRAVERLGRRSPRRISIACWCSVARSAWAYRASRSSGPSSTSASPADRLAGSLAATALAVAHGASLIRAHDVRETRDAVRVATAIRQARAAGTT